MLTEAPGCKMTQLTVTAPRGPARRDGGAGCLEAALMAINCTLPASQPMYSLLTKPRGVQMKWIVSQAPHSHVCTCVHVCAHVCRSPGESPTGRWEGEADGACAISPSLPGTNSEEVPLLGSG